MINILKNKLTNPNTIALYEICICIKIELWECEKGFIIQLHIQNVIINIHKGSFASLFLGPEMVTLSQFLGPESAHFFLSFVKQPEIVIMLQFLDPETEKNI